MNTSFEALDYVIFAIYAIVILGVGLWVSRNKKGETKKSEYKISEDLDGEEF